MLVLLVGFQQLCISQLSNKWILGYESWGGSPFGNVNMDFSNHHFDSAYFFYRDMNFEFANASICDSNGTLLFYTNGVYIANAQDDTMLNGSGLNPSWYTTQWNYYGLKIPQADLIITKPGSDSLYYLFHETNDIDIFYRPNFLYYSIINIKSDSGEGEVIVKNNILISDTLVSGCLTATKHANGRDWWLVAPEYGNDGGYYVLLITPDTIIVNHQNFYLNHLGIGQACFSPDGSKYIWNQTWDHTYFYDFDRCTGLLSNPQYYLYIDSFYWIGSSTSPNSRYGYVSHGPYIFQFDLQASNMAASLDTVAVNDGFYDPNPPWPTSFVLHQLGPAGKIYISTGNATFSLHVIDQPDSADTLCNVLQHSLSLGRFNVTIPNFPNYDLGPLAGSPCDTLGLNLTPALSKGEGAIRLAPNPANNSFYIKYDIPTNENLLFVLYDSYGKEVMRKNLYGSFKNLLVHTEQLDNGIYFWRVVSDNNSKSQPSIGKPLQGFGVYCASGKIVILH
ncbi:MAG: T9SS type A sorting domain-containing protein [Bacteroidetes bacterium]|nr:T9SS type A sorting domain-containing protein [Bacteroidota bacterium]